MTEGQPAAPTEEQRGETEQHRASIHEHDHGGVRGGHTRRLKVDRATSGGSWLGDSGYYVLETSRTTPFAARIEAGTVRPLRQTQIHPEVRRYSTPDTSEVDARAGVVTTGSGSGSDPIASGDDQATQPAPAATALRGAAQTLTALTTGQNVASVSTNGAVTYYTTLADAFTAATDCDTITLLADTTVTGQIIEVSKTITFDLNGHTVTLTDQDNNLAYFRVTSGGNLNLVGDGTLDGQSRAVQLRGGTTGSSTTVTVGSGVTLQGQWPLFLASNDGNNSGMVANVCGTIKSASGGAAVHVNGTVTSANANPLPQITIDGATLENGELGAYLAGEANVTIKNSTVKGTSVGIEIRAGSLTLENTPVTGGAGIPSVAAHGGGTTTENTVLAIAQDATGKPINVTVSGGAAVSVANPPRRTLASRVS